MPKRKIETQEATVPISAMIDIVFLLIIFFVVTASIDKEIEDESINLSNAPHGRPVTKKDPRAVTINVRKDGSMNMGMLQMTPEQISTQLTTAASKWGADLPIIIRGDKEVQHEYVKRIMTAVTETKLYKVKFDAEIGTKETGK